MVYRTLWVIKLRTKMKLDTFIFIFFCQKFGVYAIRFIYMVIVK